MLLNFISEPRFHQRVGLNISGGGRDATAVAASCCSGEEATSRIASGAGVKGVSWTSGRGSFHGQSM